MSEDCNQYLAPRIARKITLVGCFHLTTFTVSAQEYLNY